MSQSTKIRSTAILLAAAMAAAQHGTPAAAQPAANPRDVSASLRSYFEQQAASGAFSGAVIVARNGRPLFEGAYGAANVETGARNALDTRFNLASLGKALTQVAIWQLVQAGRIDLDRTVGHYLPDYPNEAVRTRVTLRQLLTMRSGVGSYWNDRFAARRTAIRTIDDYLALFATDPLEFEPGTSELYSNGGYIILGKIIETVSGMSYADYIARHVTGPAGMRDAGFFAIDEQVDRLAIGYTTESGPNEAPPRVRHGDTSGPASAPRPNSDQLPGRGLSAGGGYASVQDFLRFDQALRGRRLLDAEHSALHLGEAFANGGVSGFVGGFPGANTMFGMYGDGTTIIVFANRDAPAAMDATMAIIRILGLPAPGMRRQAPPATPPQQP